MLRTCEEISYRCIGVSTPVETSKASHISHANHRSTSLGFWSFLQVDLYVGPQCGWWLPAWMWGRDISSALRTIDLFPVFWKYQRCVTCMRKPTCLHASVYIFCRSFLSTSLFVWWFVCFVYVTFSCFLSFFVFLLILFISLNIESIFNIQTLLVARLLLISNLTTEILQAKMRWKNPITNICFLLNC